MSLTDALLLDEYREVKEVWIALRSDGIKGSGTDSDPYDGGTRQQFSISITLSNSGREATATTVGGINHGYVEGDAVNIAGVTGLGAGQWNGAYPIYAVTSSSFKYYMREMPQAAASGNPTAARLVFRFDDVMRMLAGQADTKMQIHLGPGTFETRGHADGALATRSAFLWQPKAGMQFRGSGIDVTVLKIVHGDVATAHYLAIATVYNSPIDYLVVSDLTIDCNLPGQPFTPGNTYAELACGAMRVGDGSFMRVQRVKAINWGTQTSAAECFVFLVGVAHPELPEVVNCIIEDCICVQPSENNRRETTIISIAGADDPYHVQAFSRGCILRRNFVDCAFSNGRSSHVNTVVSITRVGSTATCRTVRPHQLAVGNRALLQTVLGDRLSPWLGYVAVTEVVDEYSFRYILGTVPSETEFTENATVGPTFQALTLQTCRAGVVEDNIVLNTDVAGPWQDTFSTREVIVRRNSYRNVTLGYFANLGSLSLPPPLRLTSIIQVAVGSLEATTESDHGFGVEVVRIQLATPTALNGDWTITPIGTNKFGFSITGYNSGNETGGIAAVERAGAGLATIDTAAFANIVHLGGGIAEAKTTAEDHKLEVGDRIKVIHATRGLTDFTQMSEYIGFFEITEVPAIDKFRYKTNGTPSGDAFNASFQRLWAIDRLIIEDNHIEIREWFPGELQFPFGIFLVDNLSLNVSAPPPYSHLELIIRANSVRFINGLTPPITNDARAIQVNGIKNVVIENNVLDWRDPNAIRHTYCGTVKNFNNRSFAGDPVTDQDYRTGVIHGDVEVEIEDVTMLTL